MQTAHCPRLLTGKEAIVGQESIHTYLKDLNKKIRSKQEKVKAMLADSYVTVYYIVSTIRENHSIIIPR